MKMHFFPFQNFLGPKINIHKCRDEDPDPDQVGSVDFCAAGSQSGSVFSTDSIESDSESDFSTDPDPTCNNKFKLR